MLFAFGCRKPSDIAAQMEIGAQQARARNEVRLVIQSRNRANGLLIVAPYVYRETLEMLTPPPKLGSWTIDEIVSYSESREAYHLFLLQNGSIVEKHALGRDFCAKQAVTFTKGDAKFELLLKFSASEVRPIEISIP